MPAQNAPMLAPRRRLATWYLVLILVPLSLLISGFSGATTTPLASTASLTVIGSIGGAVHSVAIAGSLAYVGELNGLTLLSIDAPPHVRLRSRLVLPDVVYDVQISNGIAYLAVGTAGLYIVDVHLPDNPVMLGHLAGLGKVVNVAVDSTFAYVASIDTGLHIVDIQNLSGPQAVGQYSVALVGTDGVLRVAGHIAYLVTNLRGSNGGVHVIDLSIPAQPVFLGAFGSDTAYDGLSAEALDGAYLYVAGSDGIEIFDVQNPATPSKVATYHGAGSAWSIVVQDQVAYIGSSNGSLQIVDVHDPTTPALLGGYTLSTTYPSSSEGLAVDRGVAYLAMGTGLQMLDVSEPSQVVNLNSEYMLGSMLQLKIAGTIGYIAAYPNAAQMIDLADVAHPQPLGPIEPGWVGIAVQVSGSQLYVAGGSTDGPFQPGIHIYDIENPRAPVLLGAYTALTSVYDLAIDNDRLYVAGAQGLEIVDITTPSAPIRLGVLTTGNRATAVQASGNFAYLAIPGKFTIVDVANPASPVVVYEEPFNAVDIQLVGTTAYIASEFYGLIVLDVSDPAHAAPIGVTLPPKKGYAIAVEGQEAYMTNIEVEDGHLYVFDVSDPTNPTLEVASSMALFATDIVVQNRRVYTAATIHGLTILDFAPAAESTPTATPPAATALTTQTPTKTATATATASATRTPTNTPTIAAQTTATAIAGPVSTSTSIPGTIQSHQLFLPIICN